ncbi:MAG TPA: hypothetical protein VKA67_01270, partial [Verrucomicrobiae bacterium]|nr:hypothetical protein [Verrucomicrobiae bacterium]
MKFESLVVHSGGLSFAREVARQTAGCRWLCATRRLSFALILLLTGVSLLRANPANLRGSLGTHDPST